MSPWLKNTSVSLGLPVLLFFNLAFIEKGQEIELQGNFNARASRDFRAQAGNIKFVMPTGTRIRVEESRLLNSGHYGLFVEVLSGSNKSQKVWVYYNTENPRMKFNTPKPVTESQGETIKPVLGLDRPPAATAGNLDAFIDQILANDNKLERSKPSTPSTKAPVTELSARRSVPTNLSKPSPLAPTTRSSHASGADTSCSGSCGLNRPNINISEAIGAVTSAARRNISVGARQTMAVLYQSCSVLNQEPYDPFVHNDLSDYINKSRNGNHQIRYISRTQLPKLVSNHYYLSNVDYSRHRAPQCRDMRQTPPVFIYGARPQFSQNGREIDILKPRRAGEVHVTGLDCSAFASVAMSVAGLKIRPSTRSAAQNLFTSRELLSMNEHNSCMQRPTFKKGSTIQSGDIFSVDGHVLIVDRVGPDPLGIEAMKRAGLFPTDPRKCFGLTPPSDAFNFTISQSAARGNKSAMIIEASRYIRPNRNSEGIVYNRFRDVFEAACLAELGYEGPVRNRRGSTLLRHRSDDPNCVFSENEKPILKGQECTGDCLKEALQ